MKRYQKIFAVLACTTMSVTVPDTIKQPVAAKQALSKPAAVTPTKTTSMPSKKTDNPNFANHEAKMKELKEHFAKSRAALAEKKQEWLKHREELKAQISTDRKSVSKDAKGATNKTASAGAAKVTTSTPVKNAKTTTFAQTNKSSITKKADTQLKTA